MMPYKSDAQRRWAHTKKGIQALGGAAKVAEWDSASKGMSLPERKGALPQRRSPFTGFSSMATRKRGK